MIAQPMRVPIPTPPPWHAIDTVLVDLDGTLLDLAFDNDFWQRHVPEVWGRARALDAAQALAQLRPRFEARAGTLEWYCVDFWSRELGLDIPALKRDAAHGIRWLPGARRFLRAVRARGKRLVLITNSHPTVLAIKEQRTQFSRYFDARFSSHDFGAPKEHAQFWLELAKLERFDPQRSLFVDDSLPVLRAAHAAGVRSIYAVARPDSSRAAHTCEEFPAVDTVAQLL